MTTFQSDFLSIKKHEDDGKYIVEIYDNETVFEFMELFPDAVAEDQKIQGDDDQITWLVDCSSEDEYAKLVYFWQSFSSHAEA